MITTPLWWGFLLISPAIYWLLPLSLRAGAIAAMSFGILLTYAPVDMAVLGALALAVYAAHSASEDGPYYQSFVHKIARSPWLILMVLAYFVWAKYVPSIMLALGRKASLLDLAIPLGISYFTFKLLHYSIERSRGHLPDHNLSDYASYMFLAPIFTAGPIERFDHYMENRATEFEMKFLYEGSFRIAQGLVKKFVLGVIVLEMLQRSPGGDPVDFMDRLGTLGPMEIWPSLLLTSFFIYLDFSAYSDIAIGSSRLFGLRIMENFNLPFMSKSLKEFWQRYHMTLASWVLTYIYMPMVARTRNPYVAIILSFAVVGIWHKAWPLHWFLWGLAHGLGLAAMLWWTRQFQKRRSKFLAKKPMRVIGWAMTMAFVALSDVFPTLYGHGSVTDVFRIMFAAVGFG